MQGVVVCSTKEQYRTSTESVYFLNIRSSVEMWDWVQADPEPMGGDATRCRRSTRLCLRDRKVSRELISVVDKHEGQKRDSESDAVWSPRGWAEAMTVPELLLSDGSKATLWGSGGLPAPMRPNIFSISQGVRVGTNLAAGSCFSKGKKWILSQFRFSLVGRIQCRSAPGLFVCGGGPHGGGP
jgi:hypothetical protein